MKRSLYLTAIVCLMSAFCISCKKAPINEKIEGHWLVQQITTLKDNNTIYPERLYYSISRSLICVAEKQGKHNYGTYIANLEYNDNEKVLLLTNFVQRDANGDNGILAKPDETEPYGVIDPERTIFQVIKSTHNKLVIESDWARIELKRF